jgi:hypothetical protein
MQHFVTVYLYLIFSPNMYISDHQFTVDAKIVGVPGSPAA